MPDPAVPPPRGHIWIVSRVYAPDEGGVQTYAREVAQAYLALGWLVTVFAKSSAGPRTEAADGMHLIDVGPGSLVITYWRLWRALAKAWRTAARPHLIHACTWRAALPALRLRAPLLIAVHGREIGRPRGRAFRLMRFVLSRATAIVAVSAATRTLLIARLPDLASRCALAWNGTAVSTPIGERVPNDVPEILTVCRLVPRKNILAAVAAVAACRDAGHRLRYRIVGRGPETAAVATAIAARDLADTIEQLGFVDQAVLDRLHAHSDIFLHPQLTLEGGGEIEGFGISVADAMAHGLACIVGQDGGPAELVRDGETGLVVDGRSEPAIAAAIDRLLAEPALRRRLADAGQAWARSTLTWRNHAQACLDAITCREERI